MKCPWFGQFSYVATACQDCSDKDDCLAKTKRFFLLNKLCRLGLVVLISLLVGVNAGIVVSHKIVNEKVSDAVKAGVFVHKNVLYSVHEAVPVKK